MSGNSFGKYFKLTTFGESHGSHMGGVIEGCPAGMDFHHEVISRDMNRRRPGQSEHTSPRNEKDQVEILSGVFENKTLGTPIAFVIKNEDVKSSDYDSLKDVYRPGHADETWELKYGRRDHRGGGRSSARETTARVVGGAIAKMLLHTHGIEIIAWVSAIGNHALTGIPDSIDTDVIESNTVRCPDPQLAQKMIADIEKARQHGDSLGGYVTCICRGMSPGLGEPVFDKLPALMAHAMMSLPASRSFESDGGLDHISMMGSQGNLLQQGSSGGITTGHNYIMRVGFKPVSSIAQKQIMKTRDGNTTEMSISGRHDPCVLPRAVPIVEAMAALVVADLLLQNKMNQ
jgi:chorismate synthase